MSSLSSKYSNPQERRRKLRERYFIAIGGLLLGISFPPFPFPFTLLIFIALIPYISVMEKREKLHEISKGVYFYAFIFNLITLYWVGSWQAKADPFLMISGVVLVFFNPLLFLIPSTLFYIARKSFNNRIALILFPFFWIFYEYVYMITDASFPWLTLGNGLSRFTTFIQASDIVGALGLSFVIVSINLFLYKYLQYRVSNKKRSVQFLITALTVFLVLLIYGIIRLNTFELSDKKIKVGIVQPNVDPWEKWGRTDRITLVKAYLDLSQKTIDEGAKLIIWPETALPVYLYSGSYRKMTDTIHSFLEKNNVYLLTGMPHINYYEGKVKKPYDAKFNKYGNYYYATYNSVIMLAPDNTAIQFYGKSKLVPFGERVPFVDKLPFLGDWIKWGVGLTGWNVGQDTTIFKMKNGNDTLKVSGIVCYESIYPYYVDNFVEKGAQFIAVVTNDSWYGKLSGPYQHKDFAVLRAIENRRSVVRSANGGVSAVIDPLGRIEVETDMLVKTSFSHDVILQDDSTIFTKYSMVVPTLAMFISLWTILFSVFKWLKNKLKV